MINRCIDEHISVDCIKEKFFVVICKFDDLLNRNMVPIDKKDIGLYKSTEDLSITVDELSGIKSRREREEESINVDPKEAELIANTDKVLIVRPKTEAASKYWGNRFHGSTKWCTSGDDNCRFNTYYQDQRKALYYIIPKGIFAKQVADLISSVSSSHKATNGKLAMEVGSNGRYDGVWDEFDIRYEPSSDFIKKVFKILEIEW